MNIGDPAMGGILVEYGREQFEWEHSGRRLSDSFLLSYCGVRKPRSASFGPSYTSPPGSGRGDAEDEEADEE